MKGLQLRRTYWEECVRPIFKDRFSKYLDRMAVGAFGHGSEFLGFDDELSRDHHWSPGFSIFLTEEDLEDVGFEIYDALLNAPKKHHGYRPIWGSNPQTGRNGVHTFLNWLQRQCFIEKMPIALKDWLGIREYQLLWATNGEIWHDPLGEVSEIRRQLSYYPVDVWKKRLALKCHQLHQSGPYQITRCIKRNNDVTAGISLNIFLVHALEMCFLLRRRYAPFYKWVYTGFQHLPNGSQDFHEAIHILTSCISIKSKLQAIFRIMNDFKKELDAEIPTLSSVRFSPDADEASFAFGGFINVAQAVNDSISDSEFRKINYLHQAGAYDNR